MLNLHGGTTLGIATTAVLSVVGGMYLEEVGSMILSILFLGVMVVSTLFAVATIVRFFRNQRRMDIHTTIEEAKREWRDAHERSSAFSGTGL